MRVRPHLLCTTLVLGIAAGAQEPQTATAAKQQAQQSQSPMSTITVGTQLVAVDVVVLDSDGKPVRGLKGTDFVVDENKQPQAVKSFDEHTAADFGRAKLPPPLKLTPGTFSDYQPIPEDSTLNVLLLDTLNTPMSDQAYVRYQLQQYVKNVKPGSRVAIFGLNQSLIMLQGFNSDPDVLKAAIEHKLRPRASSQSDDPSGSNSDPMVVSDELTKEGLSAELIAAVQQFEAQNASFQTQTRTQYTLDAFKALGRYLAQFPGRKNVIWFSGSFPLAIFADTSIENPFAVQSSAAPEIREMTNLLSRARVAVYPVDARGLQTNLSFDSSRSGKSYMGKASRMDADITKSSDANGEEHLTMEQIAEDTGGRAFYNTNDLVTAVSKSMTAGANYYTLTYSPSNHKFDGSYRGINIQVQGAAAGRALKLSYRQGYFADDPNHRSGSTVTAATASSSPPSANGVPSSKASSMQRGSPTLSEILFKVRVLPASKATEEDVAEGNVLDAKSPINGPYRRYMIDFAALGSDFQLPTQTDGRRHGSVEFLAYLYDANGKLLNASGSTVQINLDAASYKDLLKTGLGFHQEISAPAKGESFLRLGIHDITSGHMGVVEISTTTVDRLPPPPPVTASSSSATAPTAAPK